MTMITTKFVYDEEVAGCDNSLACDDSFDPVATEDDGSCLSFDDCGVCNGNNDCAIFIQDEIQITVDETLVSEINKPSLKILKI